jgi:hypothetical protein
MGGREGGCVWGRRSADGKNGKLRDRGGRKGERDREREEERVQ